MNNYAKARKVDRNHAEVVAALRAIGATVQSLAGVGVGVPDLLVGYQGRTLLLEVKDGTKPPSARALTPDQLRWHNQWTGGPLRTVESAEEAVFVVTGRRPGVKP